MTRPDSLSRSNARKSPKASDLSVHELRGLRALRRVGTRGLLHKWLKRHMRPAHGTMTIIKAVRTLEDRGMIEYYRAAEPTGRIQGGWRITDRGRETIDALDRPLPPAA